MLQICNAEGLSIQERSKKESKEDYEVSRYFKKYIYLVYSAVQYHFMHMTLHFKPSTQCIHPRKLLCDNWPLIFRKYFSIVFLDLVGAEKKCIKFVHKQQLVIYHGLTAAMKAKKTPQVALFINFLKN